MIEVGDLVAEFSGLAEDVEAMGKALGNIELFFVLRRERLSVPLAIGCRAGTQIHGHVEDLPGDYPNQLALGELLLIVQPPKHAPAGHGLVVLDEHHVQSGLMHVILIVGFHEIAPAVPEDGRLNNQKSFDFTVSNFDFAHV